MAKADKNGHAKNGSADSFLAHVERVLGPGAARRRPAALTKSPAAHEWPADGPPRLQCGGCGWEVECLPADAGRFLRAGCFLCGGEVGPCPPGGSNPGLAAERRPPRRALRRKARGAARVEVRAGAPTTGYGPDLAIVVADVCEEGLGLWLTVPVRPGDAVQVTLVRPTGRPSVHVPGEVRWCAPAADWTYRAGLRLGRPLAPDELADLAL